VNGAAGQPVGNGQTAGGHNTVDHVTGVLGDDLLLSVTGVQRARILAATADVCAAVGIANVTVAHIVSRAGVSRRTFYEHFTDCDRCVLSALEEMVGRATAQVIEAHNRGGLWRERIRAGLGALLAYLDHEPSVAKLLDWLGAGPRALELRSEVAARVSAIIDEGRLEEEVVGSPPSLTAEGITGAIASVLHTRLLDPERGPLHELTNSLMSIVVLPYLGPVAAQEELRARRKRGAHALPPSNGYNPLGGLEMRMTYRTMRVLLAIGEHPGSSNREVGRAAGAEDQGQVSKLLSRLKRLGLLENQGNEHVKGASNAWVLTAKGAELHRAIVSQVQPDGF
jgi:AcrR family transcriptional regulator